jgi:hypothetical protein
VPALVPVLVLVPALVLVLVLVPVPALVLSPTPPGAALPPQALTNATTPTATQLRIPSFTPRH